MRLPLRAASAALVIAAMCVGLAACQDKDAPGVRDGDPGVTVRNDHRGDPLPAGALARYGSERLMHPQRVHWIEFMDDDRVLAVWGLADATVWRVSDGAPVGGVDVNAHRDRLDGNLQFQHQAVASFAASDGRTLGLVTVEYEADFADKQLHLTFWDIATGAPVHAPLELPDDAVAVSWSADGAHVLVAAASGTVEIRETDGGSTVASFEVANDVLWADLSDDATCAIVQHSRNPNMPNMVTAEIWNVARSTPTFKAQAFGWSSPFFPGTTRVGLVAGGTEWRLRVLEGTTGAVVGNHPLAGGGWPAWFAAFPGGDRILVTGHDQDSPVHVLDGETGDMKPPAGGGVTGSGPVAVSPDGRTAAVVRDGTRLHVFSVETGDPVITSGMERHDMGVAAMALTADASRVVTGGVETGDLRFWNAETGEPQGVADVHDGTVTAIVPMSGGTDVLTSGWYGAIHRVNVETGDVTATLRGADPSREEPLVDLAVSADGTLVAALTRDGSIGLHRVDTGEEAGRITLPSDTWWSLMRRPGGTDLLVTGRSQCVLVDPTTRERVGTVPWEGGPLNAGAFAADGTTVILAGEMPDDSAERVSRVEIRTGPDWRLQHSVQVPNFSLEDVAPHPDGEVAVVVAVSALWIVPMHDGPLRKVEVDISAPLHEASFDAAGDRLLVRSSYAHAVYAFDWSELQDMAVPVQPPADDD